MTSAGTYISSSGRARARLGEKMNVYALSYAATEATSSVRSKSSSVSPGTDDDVCVTARSATEPRVSEKRQIALCCVTAASPKNAVTA